ncbi:MAG: biotin--[acetyl-CoA-carboxylase] ligase [cyanobacterium endosymbiont of Rhopalodia musculus]|uniref:biotin--[acetyl-CoA-carboxylase] ligase n=1 Tax=cyanobacterium endosymbiont of Epithemia clementina EcSB TaxID=3034674 RepID=UPI002480AB9E|nr:biotin--[acetyl-CoA-carboxylase] ligase [cyanobacterium endosymbiont of Epithemia clementina EcSB]WGT66957.1 biotin--[acetyl-CoA-carboxylase] ligase [cyanobacterium endosymbiont of Epithemia clementina EcSB]
MAINQDKLYKELIQLSSTSHFLPQNLYCFKKIPSTNEILWEFLKLEDNLPIVVIASEQTAGRGQWGRTWQSPPGGLYLSVAIAPQISVKNAFHLTLLSAWGIADLLQKHQISVKLKWPNDLILEGRKLGGIKTEIRVRNGYITHAVIGVGINWSNTVPPIGITLQSWGKTQEFCSISCLEKLAAITLTGIFSGYQYYLEQGCGHLLNNYLELLDSLGHSVEVEGIKGTIVGVTPRGELQVRLQSPGAKTQINLPPKSISLGYKDMLSRGNDS